MSEAPDNIEPARGMGPSIVSQSTPETHGIAGRDRAVGFVFTESRAAGCLEDRLTAVTTLHGAGFTVREGMLDGRSVVVLVTHDAAQQPTRGVEALVDGHRPAWIISAGLAHGLTTPLRQGDVIVADRVVDAAGQEIAVALPFDPGRLGQTSKLHVGSLLSTRGELRLPAEKRKWGTQVGAMAADSGVFEIGAVCQREKVSFLAVHAIVDTVDDRLPADVAHWAGRPSLVRRLGALAGSLVHRPASIKDMWNYYEASVAASAGLAKTLADLTRLLP